MCLQVSRMPLRDCFPHPANICNARFLFKFDLLIGTHGFLSNVIKSGVTSSGTR